VHHPTEGKFGLPSWPPMAPSCLVAIKGTRRRMEESLKHSLSILRHPDSALAHSLCCVRDLSSIRVSRELPVLSFELESSLVCVGVLRFVSCVCCSPILTPFFLCDQYCKGESLQLVEIPRKREENYKEENCGIQVDHWIT
jgi:hypothetical protein